jgi:GTP cyclohydrolase I
MAKRFTIDKPKVEVAVRMLIEALGEDPEREGLRETPSRVARMLEELLSGYDYEVEPILFNESADLVVLGGIGFASLCEHHLLPFIGLIHVAYIPHGRVIGISKIVRIVRKYAARLQLQERLTGQVAEEVARATGSRDVLVISEALHTCMLVRGVRSSAIAVAVKAMGAFRERSDLLQRVLTVIQPYRWPKIPLLFSS